MAKKKRTKTEKDFWRQRSRVQHFIKRKEKIGFIFPPDIIPPIPEKITRKDVKIYEALTPEKLYESSLGRDPITNEILPGLIARERQKEVKKEAEKATQLNETRDRFYETYHPDAQGEGDGGDGASEVYTTLSTVRDMIEQWSPEPHWAPTFAVVKQGDRNMLRNILESQIVQEGEQAVAKRMQDNAQRIINLSESILYASGSDEYDLHSGRSKVSFELAEFAALIKGGPLTPEEARDLHDAQETQEY